MNGEQERLAWLHGGHLHGQDTAGAWEDHPDGGKRLTHPGGACWADDVVADEGDRLYHKPTGVAVPRRGRPDSEVLAHVGELLWQHGTITEEQMHTGLARRS